MKTKLISLFVMLFIFAACLTACMPSGGTGEVGGEGNGNSNNETKVTVSIASGEHYTVTSENPVSVKKGESATFTIEFDEGYEYKSSSVEDAVFEDGTLTVPSVLFPTTVSIEAEKKKVSITPGGNIGDGGTDEDNTEGGNEGSTEGGTEGGNEGGNESGNEGGTEGGNEGGTEGGNEGGNTEVKPEPEPEPEFKTVELSADPNVGYRFICWSLDKSIKEGGEILTEEAEGTFEIPIESEPVANYERDGLFVILYRTNGGKTADGKDYYYQTFSSENFKMPNTVYQNGTFTRPGYVLMRYTENADGSGDYTTLGGKIETNSNGFVELWLMWGKATVEFMNMSLYDNENGEQVISIDSYRGSEKNVVIPDYVELANGSDTVSYRVEKICANAFSYSDIESVVIPATVVEVEDKAFSHLNDLKEVTLHDNVWQISDDSFYDCPSLSTCYLNAGRAPTHAGSGEGLFVVKYERFRMAAARGDKKIIVASGSSSVYGFFAEMMQQAFNNEYTVINYGTNASSSFYFYMNAYMRFMGDGDIVIQAPETTSSAQLGEVEIVWRVLRQCECSYEVFSFVDMTEFYGFFDAIAEFNQTVRNTMEDSNYEAWKDNYNEYGDLSNPKDKFDYKSQSSSSKVYNVSQLTDARVARLNELNSRLGKIGVTLYMSFAPVSLQSCNSSYTTDANMRSYVAALEEKLDYDVISDPADYLLDQKYFYNSDYHPGKTGATMRTERLIADLKAKLIAEGIWTEEE